MKKICVYILTLTILISLPSYRILAESAYQQYSNVKKTKKLSDLDVKIIQMNKVVPIIREFEKSFGKEKVKQILKQEIQEQIKRAQKEARPISLKKLVKYIPTFAKENNLQYEIVKETPDELCFNITKCPYADLMKKLNAQDIGEDLICQGDYIQAAEWGLKLTRNETLMGGGTHCGFCYTVLNKMK